VLAASTVIIKLLGAIYKIPLGNILGDSGYALFYSAYSIYNVLLSLSTAGLPVAVSKMVSEANTLGHYHQVKKIYRVAFITFAVTGATGFLIMFAFAQPLAGLMKNPDAVYCIMALAPSVALVCLMSIYRGYIQGLSNMTPTAISQVLEVLFKVILGLGLSIWLKSQGYSMMIVAAGAIFGVSAGSLVSLLYLIAANRKQGKYLCEPSEAEPPADSGKLIFKRLVGIGIPILLGSLALSFTMLIDDFQIMNRLQTVAGFSYDQAKVLFGAYSKVFTVMNLPPAFVVPLTLSIIPAVTSRITMKDQEGAARICVSALRITSSLALPAGVGLCVLAQPIIHTLYSDIHSSGGSILACWASLPSFCVLLI
jgi:stage V sporulation protein B